MKITPKTDNKKGWSKPALGDESKWRLTVLAPTGNRTEQAKTRHQ